MSQLVNTIQNNIQSVCSQIEKAAQSAGRDPHRVNLVIVTKSQPVAVVQAAIEAGASILGENYPEETVLKINALGGKGTVAWHMIGHLQSRKVGLVVEYFDALHSLDSLRLAQKLDRQLSGQNKILPVLIEFNISGEESKHGLAAWDETSWDGLTPEIESILALENLRVSGSMTMPPLAEDPEQSRPYFVRLRRLSEHLARRFGIQYFSDLSMGTSIDFIPAVQEGATYVRIGQAILGPRPKK
jgi:pyridoxal phosphate enzyme (YggS family)